MAISLIARSQRMVSLALLMALANSANADELSTKDLEPLIGRWQAQWTYSPGTDEERVVDGDLNCEYTLNDLHIFCRYQFDREELPDIIEHVYFNYNPIYERYEAIWVSGTWPIKVLMSGELTEEPDRISLNMRSEFPLQNDVLEQVRSEMVIRKSGSLSRKTYIRTSEYEEGAWRHHMTETAVRLHSD